MSAANASNKAAKAVAKLKADAAKPAKTAANRDDYLARLEREFSQLATRVAKKELGVCAVCLAAGLRNLMKVEAYANAKASTVLSPKTSCDISSR